MRVSRTGCRSNVERLITFNTSLVALLVEGFGKIAVTGLKFLEQAHVLNRDGCLVSKVLDKGNLLLCEGNEPPLDELQRLRGKLLPEPRGVASSVRIPKSVEEGLGIGNSVSNSRIVTSNCESFAVQGSLGQ